MKTIGVKSKIILIAVICLWVTRATAQIQIYTNRVAWEAALAGPAVNVDFSSVTSDQSLCPAPTSVVAGTHTFTSVSCFATFFINLDVPPLDPNGYFPTVPSISWAGTTGGSPKMLVSIPTSVGIAFDWVTQAPSPTGAHNSLWLSVTGNSGTQNLLLNPSSTSGFIGVIDHCGGINSYHIYTSLTNFQSFSTANYSYSTTTYPYTPATTPTLGASANTSCSGSPITLSITAGSLNGATGWHWYSGSCGGTSVGTGTSVTVSPTATTTYYARGESNCGAPGSCGSITINVDPLWYLDADNDHYYTGTSICSTTSPGSGYTTSGILGGGDCNDANATINPGVPETLGNGVDDNCNGQIDEITPLMLGVETFYGPYLYSYNTNTWALASTVTMTMPGYTVQGGNGISYNPQNGLYYVILKVSAGGGRRLATVNPATGVCTYIGDLGDNFSSISFAPNGRLFGLTGAGASNPATLYTIDPATAAKTLKQTFYNSSGQIIAFNPDDGFLYHWSYNLFEKIDTTTYSNTPIFTSGYFVSEPTGAVYKGAGSFYVNSFGNMVTFSTSGIRAFESNISFYARGFALSTPAVSCTNPTVPTLDATSTTTCGTNSTTLTINTGTLNDATAWHWYSGSCGGTSLGTGTSKVVSPTNTTTYYVRGEGGCVTPGSCASITITVVPNTLTANSVVTPQYPMPGQKIQTIYLGYPSSAQSETITVTPSGGTTPYSYSWTRTNCNSNTLSSFSNTSNPYTFSPNASFICRTDSDNVYDFTITVTDANGCTNTQAKRINIVDPYSGALIKICHKTVIAHGPTVYSVMNVTSSVLPSHLAHGDNLGNCYPFVGRQINPDAGETISVHPNPTTGIFKVELSWISEQADILITDMQGRVIARRILARDQEPFASFDLSSLSAGLYLVQVKDGDLSYRAKIVLQ